ARRGARALRWSVRAAADTAVQAAAAAVGGAPRRQAASGNAADADRRERKATTDGLRGCGVRGGQRPDPELSGSVVAPAVGRPGRRAPAGVIRRRLDGCDAHRWLRG